MGRVCVVVLFVFIVAGCGASAPTATPTATAPAATETPTPGPSPYIPPTATPGLPLGGGPLRPDEPSASALLPEVPARFTFLGQRLQAFAFTVTPQGADLDIRLSLHDYTGNPIVVVDRHGPGAAEAIPEVGLPASGPYELRVEAVAGAGDVSVQMAALDFERTGGGQLELLDETPSTVFDLSAQAAFNAPDVYHAYTVDVSRDDVLVFEAFSDAQGVVPYFTLYDADYNVLGTFSGQEGGGARSDDTYIPADGTWVLFVGNQGAGTGPYTVRVSAE